MLQEVSLAEASRGRCGQVIHIDLLHARQRALLHVVHKLFQELFPSAPVAHIPAGDPLLQPLLARTPKGHVMQSVQAFWIHLGPHISNHCALLLAVAKPLCFINFEWASRSCMIVPNGFEVVKRCQKERDPHVNIRFLEIPGGPL